MPLPETAPVAVAEDAAEDAEVTLAEPEPAPEAPAAEPETPAAEEKPKPKRRGWWNLSRG